MTEPQFLLRNAVRARPDSPAPALPLEKRPAASRGADSEAEYIFAARHALQALNLRYREFLPQLLELPKHSAQRKVARRYGHLVSMVEDVTAPARSFGLSDTEIHLAAVCNFAHDGGRFVEGLVRSDTLREGSTRPHAEYSVQVLDETQALRFFTPQDQEAIRLAVQYHASGEVPQRYLPLKSLAWKLCYLIRDQDKYDILVTDVESYVSGQGIYDEGARHFFSRWFQEHEELLAHPQFPALCTTLIEQCLFDRTRRNFDSPAMDHSKDSLALEWNPANLAGSVSEPIRAFVDGPPSPGSVQRFLEEKHIPHKNIWRSSADYLLMQLAMVFDVQTPSIRQQIYESGALQKRLEILEPRMQPEVFNRVVEVLARHLAERLADHQLEEIETGLRTY